jgi:hypothetical protein
MPNASYTTSGEEAEDKENLQDTQGYVVKHYNGF